MKTTNENQNQFIAEIVSDENLVGIAKAIALLMHNSEKFEIVKDEEGDFCLFTVDEEGERIDLFEPIEGDEERDNYIVLTDEEADEKAKDSILESVWAFNASFLASQTGIDQEVFEAIQANNRCESNNDAILRLIEDEDEFVKEAIKSDGRGHFLNTYDGHEHEINVGGIFFYVYRMN